MPAKSRPVFIRHVPAFLLADVASKNFCYGAAKFVMEPKNVLSPSGPRSNI